LDRNCREITLKEEGLTALYHTEWMLLLTSIDLSHNALTSVKSLSNLQCLKSICLDNNHLSNLDGLQHCCHLCELSVKVNGKIIITELEIGVAKDLLVFM
jgi:hypothetical protein